MTEMIRQLLRDQKINADTLNTFQQSVIDQYEMHQLLRDWQLEEVNPFVGLSLTDIIDGFSVSEFLSSIFAAVEKESLSCVCLCMEIFFRELNPQAPVYEKDVLNVQNLNALIESKFNQIPGFYLFHQSNEDYKAGDGIYKHTLDCLNKYCGVKDADLELFFSPEFREFFDFVINTANAHGQGRQNEFIDFVIGRLLPASTPVQISSLPELDELARAHENEFLAFLDFILTHFSAIRKCTIAIVETLVLPVHLNETVVLNGPGGVNIQALDEFNKHIADILNDPVRSFANNNRREVKTFLEKQCSDIKEKGGFIEVVRRQTALQKLAKKQRPFSYILSGQKSMDDAAVDFQLNAEDLQTMNRLNFVLSNRSLLSDSEFALMAGKIVPILKSYASNYFSDIFELYFLIITKKSGLNIELIPSQTKSGKEVSTCDYKIGDRMGADAKCINGGAEVGFQNISSWLGKVSSQVEKSTGWMNISFGGAVIGIRDKHYGFLEGLHNFKGKDKSNLTERHSVIRFILELYSEYRRHTGEHPELIKFVVFYYIPEVDLPVFKFGMPGEFRPEPQQEIMFVLSTKYATEQEIEIIQETFKPVTHFLFKFNNKLK